MREFQRVANAGRGSNGGGSAPTVDERQVLFADENEFDRSRFAVNKHLETHRQLELCCGLCDSHHEDAGVNARPA